MILAAVQEERFSRIKNDASFPAESIRYCLSAGNISFEQLDAIVFYEKPFLKFERLLETYASFAPRGFKSFMKSIPLWITDKLFQKKKLIRELRQFATVAHYDGKNLLFSQHHRSHAASAFYPSPFEEALILTIDGVGEWDTTAISVGKGNEIIQKKEIHFPHSIGLLYSAVTYYLGFKVNSDEYKVMGLAPYGKPLYREKMEKELCFCLPDGSFQLNMRYFNFATGLTMTNQRFDELFGRPVRSTKAALSSFHMDMAASIQSLTQDLLLRMANAAYAEYPSENLCLAGGVALNCVANNYLRQHGPFKNIWVQPAAGDAGGALGAALQAYHGHFKQARITPAGIGNMQQCLLGPAWTNDEIKLELNQHQLSYEWIAESDWHNRIAAILAAGKTVGYFRGRMEFGPRALGARSILADPRLADMQSRLNQQVKFRESFRPFAPAVLEEEAASIFENGAVSPFMSFTTGLLYQHRLPVDTSITGLALLQQKRSGFPAITHMDYSARVQTVGRDEHPDFHALLSAFYQQTGCPLLVNTSFNRMDEPIVCHPAEAIACWQATALDALAIGNFLLVR